MIKSIINAISINSGGGLVYLSLMHKSLDKSENLILLDKRVENKLDNFKKAKVFF